MSPMYPDICSVKYLIIKIEVTTKPSTFVCYTGACLCAAPGALSSLSVALVLWLTDSIHRRLRFAQGNLRVGWPGNGVILVGVMEGMMTVFIPLIHRAADPLSLFFFKDFMHSKFTELSHFYVWPKRLWGAKGEWLTFNMYWNSLITNVFQCSLVYNFLSWWEHCLKHRSKIFEGQSIWFTPFSFSQPIYSGVSFRLSPICASSK